jgi:hypothetical protein
MKGEPGEPAPAVSYQLPKGLKGDQGPPGEKGQKGDPGEKEKSGK